MPRPQRFISEKTWQGDVARHLADRAWSVAVAGEARIGAVAVGEQRSTQSDVGPYESVQRSRRVVRDRRQPNSAGTGVEIFCAQFPRLGPVRRPIHDLDRAGNNDLAGLSGIEEGVIGSEGNLGLIDLDHPFQKRAIRIDHRAAQLLRQKPCRLVGHAKLGCKLQRWNASPSDAPPRTILAAATSSDAEPSRP
jgi:hypothetical protein